MIDGACIAHRGQAPSLEGMFRIIRLFSLDHSVYLIIVPLADGIDIEYRLVLTCLGIGFLRDPVYDAVLARIHTQEVRPVQLLGVLWMRIDSQLCDPGGYLSRGLGLQATGGIRCSPREVNLHHG